MKKFGGPEVLYIGQAPIPTIRSQEVLIAVRATALNRADLLQRRGLYPSPRGKSTIMGLEAAGTIIEVGSEVTRAHKGDRVCCLLDGGGYAEYVAVHEDLLIHIPEEMSYKEAAAIPEVFLTAYQSLRYLADLQQNERILIHAGASGVGTAAIQLARNMSASWVVVTCSKEKHQLCLDLGAHIAIDYRTQAFDAVIRQHTGLMGVDVIIDFIGGELFSTESTGYRQRRPYSDARPLGQEACESRSPPNPTKTNPDHRLDT